MTARKAFGTAFRVWKAHPLDTLCFLLVELCLRGIALAPLLFLTDASLRWGAVLALPLWLLIVPLARQNAADAMADALRGGRLCTPRLVSLSGCDAKLRARLLTGLCLLLCAAPAIAASLYLYKLYTGEEAFAVIRQIISLGGGSMMNGIKLGMLIYLACFLPLIFGCAWHCGDRHALAQGNAKKVRRRHGALLRSWLIGLPVFLPFAAVAFFAGKSYVDALIGALMNMSSGSFSIPKPDANLYVILAAAAVLLLPVVPLKQLIPAALIAGEDSGRAA